MPMQPQPFYHRDSSIALTNAQYGIERLKEEPKEFVFYLRGTLAALGSVRDYILEEYNKKLELGVPLDERLDPGRFRKKALESKNVKALEFIDEFDREWEALMSDSKVKAIIGERHKVVHRGPALTQISTLLLTPDQRYELVGDSTLHFRDPESGEPFKETVAESCNYCLSKLGDFRGYFVFVFK